MKKRQIHAQLFWDLDLNAVHTVLYRVPTHYRTRHFFNNFTINEDIATKSEVNLPDCVRNVKERNVFLFKFCCNIFISVRIIKEMPGSVASGTPCLKFIHNRIALGIKMVKIANV
jgi:hypothetical protein